MKQIPRAQKGRRVSTTEEDKQEVVNKYAENNVEIPEYEYTPEVGRAYATVGIGFTTSTSTQFGREKVEVSNWVSLPCDPDAKSMAEAHEAAKYFIAEYHDDTWKSLEEDFFPEHEETRQREAREGKI